MIISNLKNLAPDLKLIRQKRLRNLFFKLLFMSFLNFLNFFKLLVAPLEGTLSTGLLNKDVELKGLPVGVFIFF